jgi:Zn-dependent alcohol dehydrogenase
MKVPQVVISAYGGPEVFTFEETILPPPGAGEVRVRVAAAGLTLQRFFVVWGSIGMLLPHRLFRGLSLPVKWNRWGLELMSVGWE